MRHVLEEGFWAGMTLYPVTQVHAAAGVDIVEMYGPERLLVNSAGDWGPSKPTAVPDFIMEMRRRGHPGGADSQGRVREPAGVLSPEPEFSFHAAGWRRGGGAR